MSDAERVTKFVEDLTKIGFTLDPAAEHFDGETWKVPVCVAG